MNYFLLIFIPQRFCSLLGLLICPIDRFSTSGNARNLYRLYLFRAGIAPNKILKVAHHRDICRCYTSDLLFGPLDDLRLSFRRERIRFVYILRDRPPRLRSSTAFFIAMN